MYRPCSNLPKNQDGEVDAIETRSIAAVVDAIERDEFTLESALAKIESLTRRDGIATPGRPVPLMLDPVVLFFLLGVGARLAKSGLHLPEAMYDALAIYLLLAIGLKGGVELARHPSLALLPHALAAIALGAAIPLLLYPILRALGRLSTADSAAIAAHYGSVSVVTFAVATSVLLRCFS